MFGSVAVDEVRSCALFLDGVSRRLRLGKIVFGKLSLLLDKGLDLRRSIWRLLEPEVGIGDLNIFALLHAWIGVRGRLVAAGSRIRGAAKERMLCSVTYDLACEQAMLLSSDDAHLRGTAPVIALLDFLLFIGGMKRSCC